MGEIAKSSMTSRSSLASCARRRAKLPSPWATCSSSNSRAARTYSTEKPLRAAWCASAQASQVLPLPVAPVISKLRAWRSQSPPASAAISARSSERLARQLMSSMQADADLELGGLEQPGHAPVVAPGDLALHQQRQSLVEAQAGGGGAGGLLLDGAHHAVQAQAAQLVQGVFVQHGSISFGGGWVGGRSVVVVGPAHVLVLDERAGRGGRTATAGDPGRT